MNKAELKHLIRQTLKEFGYKTNKVAVEINGELDYYTELEIRALQLIAARKAKVSQEKFEEFCNSIVIYKTRHKGRKKDKSDNIMRLKFDGYFEERFPDGFYDTANRIMLKLVQINKKDAYCNSL